MGGRWDNFRWYSTEKNNTRGTQLKLITENRTRKVKLYTKHKRESDTKVKLFFWCIGFKQFPNHCNVFINICKEVQRGINRFLQPSWINFPFSFFSNPLVPFLPFLWTFLFSTPSSPTDTAFSYPCWFCLVLFSSFLFSSQTSSHFFLSQSIPFPPQIFCHRRPQKLIPKSCFALQERSSRPPPQNRHTTTNLTASLLFSSLLFDYMLLSH